MKFTLPFFKKKDVVGLDIGSNSIKLIHLIQGKRGWQLINLGIAPLPPDAIVDASIIDSMTVTNTIRELVESHDVTVKDTVSALPGQMVIIKKVGLPAMTEEELAESIQWEAEKYIPFPVADVNIDFQILGTEGEGKGRMEVMLVAVKKDVINDYTNVIVEAGLNPVVVDVDAFALENMFEVNYTTGPNENVAIVNIGASFMTMSILMGGVTTFTRTAPVGGNIFTEGIQKQLNVSFKDAETLKLGGKVEGVDGREVSSIMERVSDNMSMEIKRSIDFFLGGGSGGYVTKIYLSGGCSKVKGLATAIQGKTDVVVELVNPFSNVVYNPKVFDPNYIKEVSPLFTVGVGLAIRRLGDR
ncbi:MAG: type IV pilus assembly protein PilM [Deltaproteobacteria bacterium]|nr:type IV pilus assembly protein PilM [Deltaproteobacteria bacterium]